LLPTRVLAQHLFTNYLTVNPKMNKSFANTKVVFILLKYKYYLLMQQIILRFYHPGFEIALNNWNEVWLIAGNQFRQLHPEYYRGSLVYRLPGTSKRLSYKKIKASLCRRQTIIDVPFTGLPF